MGERFGGGSRRYRVRGVDDRTRSPGPGRTPGTASPPSMGRRGAWPSPGRWGLLAVVVVLLALVLWATWTWWGSTLTPNQRGPRAADKAVAAWSATPAPTSGPTSGPRDGDLVAVMRIPALGQDWRWPVYASTDDPDRALDHGLAWYRGTALPGQVGNFAVAGRSATGADAFRGLVDVGEGQPVIVETAAATYHYVIDVPASQLTVRAEQDWVLDPVPGHPDASAQQPVITLTTNQDKLRTGDRSVAFGHLVRTESR